VNLEWLAWGVTGAALLFALYVDLSGRALFGHRERPERIIGKTVKFSSVDWMRETTIPSGNVASFDGDSYLVELSAPVTSEKETFTTIRLRPRHKGHSVSSAKRRGILVVTGETPKGQGFIACLNVV